MAISRADHDVALGVNVTSLSLSLTIPNADSYLIVAVQPDAEGNTIDALTWEGNSLLPVEDSLTHSGTTELLLAYATLANPATASPGTLEVTFGGNQTRAGLWAVALEGVDLASPLGTVVTGEGTDSVSYDVASAVDEVVIDITGCTRNRAYTVGADQTELVNTGHGTTTGTSSRHYLMSQEDGAATVDIDWTADGFNRHAFFGLPVQPASGGSGPSVSLGTATFNLDPGASLGVSRGLDPFAFDLAPQTLTPSTLGNIVVPLGVVSFALSPQQISRLVNLGVTSFDVSVQDLIEPNTTTHSQGPRDGTYQTYEARGLREHLEPDHNPHALPRRVIEKAMQQANDMLEDS